MEHVNNVGTAATVPPATSAMVATGSTTTTSATGTTTTTAAAAAAGLTAATVVEVPTAAVPAVAKQPPARPQRSLVPPRWEDQVRAIGIGEHKEAALSLAQAFARDDLAQYLVDGERGASDEAKWRLHVDIFTYLVAAHCYSGAVTTIGPDYEGVALWVLPGQNTDEWMTTLRSGLWRLPWQLSAEGRRRYYAELVPLLHDTKLEVMGDRDLDCYYLVYLGTKPSGRGRGYGRKLIEQMAARADAEGRAMYLESSSPKNNLYYKKFGFEIKKDIHLGASVGGGSAGGATGGGSGNQSSSTPPVTLTIMVREPQKPLAHSIPIKLSGGAFSKVMREKTSSAVDY
ncbi:hypothetical protein SLS62_007585 [Diatrype stigma]|uniref:N-acetyltransferase domain-containing protein n=1 Tax=Diatrype stigma TaxID=117547 RepID=A0AAN9UMI1_9PEZI